MSKKSLQSSRRKSETGQNSKIEIADLHLSNFELYRHRGDIGKSFAELSLALCILPSLKEIYYTSYLEVFESWITSVEEKYGFERSMTLFEVALKHYPNSSDLKYLLAKILYRHGSLYEAWSYACLAHSGCSEDPNAQETRDHLTNALIDRWHLPMLNDVHRNMSFKNVIDEAVKNDHDCVLDIGSGTSLLSIYAKWAGAREVYGCEINKFMCEISKDVLASNGSTSGVKIFNLHSQELVVQKHIPKRVSLVVSETVDAGLFGEHILLTLQHAWNHLLLPPHSAETSPINASDNPFEPCGSQVHSLEKQDKRQSCSTEDSKSAEAGIGTEERGQVIDLDVSESMNSLVSKKMHGLVIPSRAEVFVALVSCEYIAKYTKLIHSDIPLFLNKNVSLKLEEPYLSEKLNQVPGGIKLLSDWIPLTKVNFNCPDDINRHLSGALNKTLEIKCTNDGILDAIVVAFNLYTDDKNCISTFPEAQSVAWENAIYPSPTRNTYHVGDVLKIGFECNGVIKLNFESPIGNETINDTETLHLPTDALTFLNSKKFVSYFTHAAAVITEHLMSRSKGDLSCSLVICDTTPFPIAGVSLMRKFTNSQLFVEKRSVLIALKALGIHAMLSEDLENEIDVLFIWPVTKEGTLRDGILKKILMY
ncbi:putative class I-like SAM-binding methyltransferase superfamily, partial [Halocaridina rubra]